MDVIQDLTSATGITKQYDLIKFSRSSIFSRIECFLFFYVLVIKVIVSMSTNAVSTMADAVRIASIREALFIVLVVTSIIWRLMDVLVLNCLRGVLAYRRQRTVKLTASKTWTIHFTSYANKMMNLYWPKTDAEIWERAGAIVHKNPESFTTLDPLASFVAIRDLN